MHFALGQHICNTIIFSSMQTLQFSAFGLGTMVYVGLEFGSWFEIPGTPRAIRTVLEMCQREKSQKSIIPGCARREPCSSDNFHLHTNVFCLHELSGIN